MLIQAVENIKRSAVIAFYIAIGIPVAVVKSVDFVISVIATIEIAKKVLPVLATLYETHCRDYVTWRINRLCEKLSKQRRQKRKTKEQKQIEQEAATKTARK